MKTLKKLHQIRVMLVDEQCEPGGTLLTDGAGMIDGLSSRDWLAKSLAELGANPRVTILTRATAFGYFAHNMIAVNERLSEHQADPVPGAPRERLWQIRAGEVVIAAGAHERPLVFPDNDRPGILLAGAARTYLNRYGVLPGRRVVIATGHDEAYRTAIDLSRAGVEVAVIADLRPWACPSVRAAPSPAARAGVGSRLRGCRPSSGRASSARRMRSPATRC